MRPGITLGHSVSQDPPTSRERTGRPALADSVFLHLIRHGRTGRRGTTREGNEGKRMPRKNSAVEALRKLDAEREALAARQRELEEKASLELGQVILGSGLERFSNKGLR